MNKTLKASVAIFLGMYLPIQSSGQQASAARYSLLHAAPKEQMRDMETDRPDVTESPITVDAGHFQYETDLVRRIRERTEQEQISTILINQLNLKIGITNTADFHVGFQSYGRQVVKGSSSQIKETSTGYGDLTLRIKQNLLGNDRGDFALAVLPYLRMPTSKFDDGSRLEGGLILPMQYKLPREWRLGFQLEVDRLKDQDQQAMHTEWLQSLTLSHSLFRNLGGMAETYYTYDFKAHQWSNYLNASLQMDVAKDVKIDAGVNYGIQSTAEKHYFVGASCRF